MDSQLYGLLLKSAKCGIANYFNFVENTNIVVFFHLTFDRIINLVECSTKFLIFLSGLGFIGILFRKLVNVCVIAKVWFLFKCDSVAKKTKTFVIFYTSTFFTI